MNQTKDHVCEHMKFLTFDPALNKLKHPNVIGIGISVGNLPKKFKSA